MTGIVATYVVALALALLVGWVIPSSAMRRLLPVLEGSGHLVTNYRGRRIPTGLGLVWLVWAAAAGAAIAVVLFAGWLAPIAASQQLVQLVGSRALSVVMSMPMFLVMGAFAFGFVDDVYGAGSEKGFRGHLRAIREGRITTGGLKLFGIGLLAAVATIGIPEVGTSIGLAVSSLSLVRALPALAAWACATLVVALAANLVNLMDLRPGRAIKTYGLLVVVAVMLYAVRLLPALPLSSFTSSSVVLGILDAKIPALCVGILLLGPVVAIWKFDLGERAMLGDAGANAMGALAGYFLAYASPLWLLAVLAVALLSLNLASERVSFSRVIERFALLRWIDGLGRFPVEPLGMVSGQDDGDGVRAGGSAAEDDDARRDGGISRR